MFLYFAQGDTIVGGIWVFLMTVVQVAIYFLVFYYLIFKTESVIQKLQLEKGFSEEKFSFNIHRSSVLSIIIVITGILVIVDAIPTFCKQLFLYIQEIRMTYRQTNPDMSKLLVTIAQLIIGLVLIGSQKQIVNFIERKRRNTSIQDEQQTENP
ncbi:MAG TPA: hypothetical protein VGQ09_08390 [Chitinophagaceae bacterium]|nr:hypothetical protein [Chitinophagaceae bacterium]